MPVPNLDLLPICLSWWGKLLLLTQTRGQSRYFQPQPHAAVKVLGTSPRWAFLDSALKQLLLGLHFTALHAGGLDPALFSLVSFFMPLLPPPPPPPKNSKLLFTSALISALVIFVVVLCSVLFHVIFILWLSHF